MELPAFWQSQGCFAKILVELFRLLAFHQAFPIGWITDNAAIGLLAGKLPGVRLGEADQVLHIRLDGIALGNGNGLGLYIVDTLLTSMDISYFFVPMKSPPGMCFTIQL